MSLDFYIEYLAPTSDLFRITHNLGKMAEEAGIYKCLWRPEENDFKTAESIIPILEKGYEDMKSRPDHYKQFDSKNGWGLYIHFLPFVKKVLDKCKEHPEGKIRAWV